MGREPHLITPQCDHFWKENQIIEFNIILFCLHLNLKSSSSSVLVKVTVMLVVVVLLALLVPFLVRGIAPSARTSQNFRESPYMMILVRPRREGRYVVSMTSELQQSGHNLCPCLTGHNFTRNSRVYRKVLSPYVTALAHHLLW
jgi:hypothetical protein